MSLPDAWTDKIFEKLAITYGTRFAAMYDGMAIEKVKSDWSATLSALQHRPEAISFALESLPPDHPPTSLQFRELARACPAQPQRRLPMPECDQKVKAEGIEVMRHFARNFGKIRNPLAWACKLQDRERRRESLTPFQKEAWRYALRADRADQLEAA